MDIREMILERVEFCEDFTLITEKDTALELIDEYITESNLEYFEEDIEMYDIVAVSLVNGNWIIESAFYEDEMKYMESDMFIIDKDILELIDLYRLEGSIVIENFEIEFEDIYDEYLVNDDCCEEKNCECGCCASDEEYGTAYAMEDIIEDTLIELEDSECEWCAIEKAVRRGYSVGYTNALRMMKGAIEDILEG